MERKKYDEVAWYRANLFGMIVFVTEDRIDRRDLPGSPYVYELRHDDDGDWTTPVEICNSVAVNFCMTLVSFEPLPVNLKYHYVTIEHGDFWMRPDTKYNLEALEKHFRGSRFNIPPDRIHHYSTTLFISQPFTGKDIKEIKKQRKLLHELYALYTERPIEYVKLINQLDPEDKDEYRYGPEGSQRFNQYTFCRSIGMMGSADVVLFYGDWKKSRGCRIERKICDQYSIPKLSKMDLIQFCIDHPQYDDDYFMPLWKKEFFNIHKIADVMIEMVEGPDLFKASLKSNGDKDDAWHQLEGYGNSPNDAYMDLNKKLDDNFENDSDAIAEKIFNEQLEKLSSATGFKVVICDDAETITAEDIEKSLKFKEPFDSQTEEMISEVKRHKPDLDLAIFKETLKHMSVPERKGFIQDMLNGLKDEEDKDKDEEKR